MVRHTHEVLEKIQDLRFAMQSISAGSFGYASTGRDLDFVSYSAGVEGAERDLIDLRELTADNPVQQRALPRLAAQVAENIRNAKSLIALRKSGGLAQGVASIDNSSNQAFAAAFSAGIGVLQQEELRLLAMRELKTKHQLSQTKSSLIFGALLGLFVAAAAGWIARRDGLGQEKAGIALREGEARFRNLANNMSQLAWIADEDGAFQWYNQRWFDYFGTTREAMADPDWEASVYHPDHYLRVKEEIGRCFATGEIWESTFPLLGADGVFHWFLSRAVPIHDAAGKVLSWFGTNTDVSELQDSRGELAQTEARYRGLLEAAPDAMVVVDQRGKIVLLNVQAEKQFGYRRDELLEQEVKNIIPEGFAERLVTDALRSAEDALAQQIGTGIELIGRRRNGSEFPIEIMLSPLESVEGTLITVAIRDITLRKKAEETLVQKLEELRHSNEELVQFADLERAMARQMTHSAQHDFLTGLPNRLLLSDRVGQAIGLSQRHRTLAAVLFLDLDGFKHINDSLGHAIGDKLLQSIAERLAHCVRPTDTVSRQGGDEFVILLSEAKHPEDAAVICRRLLLSVAEAHSIGHHDLHITASIGISVFPDDGLDAETLIKNADTAMYQAKENGRDNYQFFMPAMNARAVERQSIEEHLRRALERKEFSLHYQPKVDLRDGRVTGAEALLRWDHPTRGSVSPAQFIPVAEDCGLILAIGAWVLEEACCQAQAWSQAGLPALTMAVNVSAMQFKNERFLEDILAILSRSGLEARYLELELTESALMKHAETTASILVTLRELGVKVAVDDFGTGYSSLSYLRKFPLDALKIDQSFVRQISTTPDETTIVRAIISMGRSLNLRIIAEGVETLEELDFLKLHECEEAQGYYFSRPVPPENFAQLLASHRPANPMPLRAVAAS